MQTPHVRHAAALPASKRHLGKPAMPAAHPSLGTVSRGARRQGQIALSAPAGSTSPNIQSEALAHPERLPSMQ